MVGIWRDKREVRFMSTKHGIDFINSGEKNKTVNLYINLKQLFNQMFQTR